MRSICEHVGLSGLCLITAVGTVLSGGLRGDLHVVDHKLFPMAAAIDGSPVVYYLRPSSAASSSQKWVIFLDGGDFCGYGDTEVEQLHDCYRASKTDLGSSHSYLKKPHMDMTPQSPLFHHSSEKNPLTHDWNWVYIPYLDGGYYAGTRQDTPVVNGTPLHFRGAFNIEAIISSLAKSAHLNSASDVIFTGCSSGGVAVIANADHLHDLIHEAAPAAKLSAFVDSGYYLHVNTEYWTRPVLSMQHLGRTLNTPCQAAMPKHPWDCIVAEVAAPFIQRLPVFVWESRYDTNQLGCVNINASDVKGVNSYGERLLRSVTKWVSMSERAVHRGAFVDACSRHCDSQRGIVAHDGLTPVSAFTLWYHKGPLALNGSAVVQPGHYPCKSCCASRFADVVV